MDEQVEYCREIEAYLCRKNGGHLIRIVGPAFEKVRGWAAQGIPLKIALRGIDRCCDRAAARGGRRRPLRVEFCEADVLEAFDDWRRALGVNATQVSENPGARKWEPTSRKESLAAHVERSLSRLMTVRPPRLDAAFDDTVSRITRELDEIAAVARKARGDTRDRAIRRLAELDTLLVTAATATLDAEAAAALQKEADAELGAFASRMPPESRSRIRQLAFQRLLRETANLPVLTYE